MEFSKLLWVEKNWFGGGGSRGGTETWEFGWGDLLKNEFIGDGTDAYLGISFYWIWESLLFLNNSLILLLPSIFDGFDAVNSFFFWKMVYWGFCFRRSSRLIFFTGEVERKGFTFFIGSWGSVVFLFWLIDEIKLSYYGLSILGMMATV